MKMVKNMTQIDKLIKELCPKGVEFKELGEVCEKIFAGGTPSSQNTVYYGGKIPWLRSGEINFNKITNTAIKITEEGLNNSSAKWVPAFSVFIAMTGATVARTAVNMIPLTANQSCCCMVPKINILNYKFLYYILANRYIELKNMGQGVLTSLNTARIKSIKIPLPPIPIQEEIVKILDSFTELEVELEAELKARKKQYEYYKDDLLTFGDDVEWKTIKDLFDFKNGLNKGKEFFGKGTPIINFTDVFKNHSLISTDIKGKVDVTPKEKLLYKAQKNDIFFTRTSETKDEIGMVCALLDNIEDCVFSGFVLRARPKTDLLNPKFCSYYLSSFIVRKEIIRNSTFTTRALTSGPKLAKIQIPLPPLKKQERIVDILDKFDALVNDISVGLPAELEARRKQYEYYREKLLTFKEKSVSA